MAETRQDRRKVREGIVVSTAMDKTIVVRVDRLVRHPRYGKVIRRSKKVHVHAENGSCKLGDVVRIEETRPLSKTKCWRYVETVREAVQV
ncbi:MAG: 30S ribosomal protein S17 [bacterium]|nr:30S ribosomal protein S17 [bacterium]